MKWSDSTTSKNLCVIHSFIHSYLYHSLDDDMEMTECMSKSLGVSAPNVQIQKASFFGRHYDDGCDDDDENMEDSGAFPRTGKQSRESGSNLYF